jgi:hypothetical protein
MFDIFVARFCFRRSAGGGSSNIVYRDLARRAVVAKRDRSRSGHGSHRRD